MSNHGDNAVAESFLSSLKKERTRESVYQTVADARADVFGFIEGFYDRKWRQSTLGQLSPLEFETKKRAG